MSTNIEINGETLVSIKEAAKIVSYSRDYLTKLAREQKIVATQIGRQWYIDMRSLNVFIEDISLEQVVRKEHLRSERRRELQAKEELQLLNSHIKNKESGLHLHSLAMSSVVLCLGLFTGAIIYTTSDISNNIASNDIENSSLVAQVTVDEEVVSVATLPQNVPLSNSEMEYPLFVNEEEVRAMDIKNEGVFLLSSEGEVKTAEQVANLFSDQVNVEFLDENTGLVKYKNNKGEISEFPFVSVPDSVNDLSSVSNQSP